MIFSIIIPIYNEENTILELLRRLDKLKFSTFKKEIIVIDDGSSDNTRKILEDHKNLYDKIYFNQKNEGKGSAVRLGLNKSKGDYIVIQDGDLEYDPNDLIKFEKVFLSFQADGIIGSRFSYDQYIRSHSILNKFANFLLTFFFNILYNTTFTDIYSCYLCFKRELLEPSQLKTDGFDQHAEILSKAVKKGNRFYEVPISYNGRSHAEGKKIKFYHFFSVILRIFIERF